MTVVVALGGNALLRRGEAPTPANQAANVSVAADHLAVVARTGRPLRLDEAVGACGADCPALLGLVARRTTRCAHFVRCARTSAASQNWKHAARAATSTATLGAS